MAGYVRLGAAALAIMLLGTGPSWSKPAPAAPAATPFQVGGLQVYALRDAENVVDNDGKTFGVGVPTPEVARVLTAAGAPADPITLSVDALLVKAGGRVMLFDSGLGPTVHGVLIQSLAKAGVAPGEVTDVFITHSHFDHVGGLLDPQGRSAFPRAVIHMSAREWAFMQSQAKAAAEVAAIAAQVKPFEPGGEPVPGVTTVALYGHTPGHTGYRIASQGQVLFDMGDTAHSSIVSLARPEWTIQYDQDAAHGRANREATLAKLAADHTLVFAPHFPYPGVGHVEASGHGFVWRPATP